MDDLIAARRRRSWFLQLALIALVLVVFGRVVGHEFVNFDDDRLIYANANLVPPTWSGLAAHWREAHEHLYIPMVYTVWWLIAQIALVGGGGAGASGAYSLNPWIFHAANLLVHVACVLLVFHIVRTVVEDDVAAALGAAVFAVHPLVVEPVAWATGMKDLLCAAFSLLALLAALEAARSPSRRRAIAFWALAAGCYFAALLSKPAAATLPLGAALMLYLAQAGTARTRWVVVVVGLALAIPIVFVTRHVQPAFDVAPTSIASRPFIAGDALTFYLRKIIAPIGLAVDYGRTPAAALGHGAAYGTSLIPVALTLALVVLRKWKVLAAWAVFIITLAPTLGLLTFQYQVVSTVSDRYVYLGLLVLAIVVAWIAQRRSSRVIVLAVVLILAGLSFVQAGRWRDSRALWRQTLEVNPNSALAAGNLGNVLLESGDVGGAIESLKRAVAIDPNDAFANLNLARALLVSGDTAGAAQSALDTVAAYRRRADFNPELSAALLERFARQIDRRGDAAAARRLMDESRRLSPTTVP